MKVNRAEFLGLLGKVLPGVASKDVVEQSHSFVFKDDKVMTFNDEIFVSSPLVLGIEGAVKAEECFKALSKMKGEEVEVVQAEADLIFTSGKTEIGLKLEADIKLPVDSIPMPKKWHKLPADFAEAVKFCRFSCSSDFSRPILTMVHVVSNVAEACNNYRLTQYFMEGQVQEEFCLPSSIIEDLLERAPVQYGLTEGWVHFKCDKDVVFSSRVTKEEYPDASKLSEFEGEMIKFPVDMKEILERIGIMSRKEFKQDEIISFSLQAGKIEVTSENSVGWARETTRIRYNGNPITFCVNTDFMVDACSLLNDIIVGEGRIKLESDKFIHVVLLVQA